MFTKKYEIIKDHMDVRACKPGGRPGIVINNVGFGVAHDVGNPGTTAKQNVSYQKSIAHTVSSAAHVFIDDEYIIETVPCLTSQLEKAFHVVYNYVTDNLLFGDDANDIAGGMEACYGSGIDITEVWKRYIWAFAYYCYLYKLNPLIDLTGHFILQPVSRVDPTGFLAAAGKTWGDFILEVKAEFDECFDGNYEGFPDADDTTAENDTTAATEDTADIVIDTTIDVSTRPQLSNGMSGSYVAILEHRLQELGYMDNYVDDYFGTATKAAVKQFQSDNGLSVDGCVGSNTWTALYKDYDIKINSGGYTLLRFNEHTNVHVFASSKTPELVLGVKDQRETLDDIAAQYDDVACAINAQMFAYNGSENDGYGVIITDNAKGDDIKGYYQRSSPTFVDYIVWEDGTVTIEQVEDTSDVQRLVKFQKEAEFAVGTSYAVMINGEKSTLNWEKFSHYDERHNRSMVAYDSVNNMHYLIVTDGRTDDDKGLTAEEQYQLAKMLGITDMANLDGGGSSVMIVGNEVVTVQQPIRSIGTALIVQS